MEVSLSPFLSLMQPKLWVLYGNINLNNYRRIFVALPRTFASYSILKSSSYTIFRFSLTIFWSLKRNMMTWRGVSSQNTEYSPLREDLKNKHNHCTYTLLQTEVSILLREDYQKVKMTYLPLIYVYSPSDPLSSHPYKLII